MLPGFAPSCRVKSGSQIAAAILLVLFPFLLNGSTSAVLAQSSDQATPPSAPPPGKARIYIYRPGRFVGSAAHDHLFINGVYVAYLLNGEYAWLEVAPGNAVVTGMPEMYYGGIIQSTGAALSEARRKENERIRLDVAANQTYYLKWTSGTMATGIKVALMDPGVGAKEMSKLHPSKPVEQPDDKTKDKWK
jgi:hypothetical protein